VPDILVLLDESPADIAAETEELHPHDLADIAEALPAEKVPEFLRALGAARAADVLEYLDEELRTELLEKMSATQAAELVTAMTPDDRVDVLEELEEERAEEILSEIPAEARRETEELLAYDPDTAGGLMTTRFVSVPKNLTSEAALAVVREVARAGKKEQLYAIYVLEPDGTLVGVMSLRELLAAPDGITVGDSAHTEIVSVATTADRAEVARVTSEYDLVAVPVVDNTGRMLGVITVDDVIDAIVEEQTEDVQKLGAVQPLDEPYFQASFWSIARKRAGWLVILFLGELFTATAMRGYEDALRQAVVLTIFIPLIISSGGNSGSQSATLITRALAVGHVALSDVFHVLRREVGHGVLLGALLGSIGYVSALVAGQTHMIGVVVAVTLLLVVTTGTTVGSMLPLALTRVGVDPAIASSPFVASIVDVTGIIIYFNVAIRLLGLA
ncbi:MAG TPA: magnesium transporter, partial [Gemmatimonadaceae bacterium]|nr:magnesium transporter [Gemmatimonadaceae bacterium]